MCMQITSNLADAKGTEFSDELRSDAVSSENTQGKKWSTQMVNIKEYTFLALSLCYMWLPKGNL